ncbi:MAG: DUF4190 domain-containing protein [Planctomycetota bacterium]|nr:DUF4190 domain-containing protein [Planctomycetota bacterium]
MSRAQAPPWSPWALIGLACSVGLCPVVTMLGVLFGVLALRDIRTGKRRGRGVAITAIVIGIVVTPVTTFGLLWWNHMVREPMLHGPLEAIQAGQAGDVEAFRQAFLEPSASGVEAAQFLGALTDRFGSLVSITQDPERDAAWDPSGWSISVPYFLQFNRDSVPGTARYVILDREGGRPIPVFRFAWVRIGQTPPLTFPPGAGGDAELGAGVQDAQ